jgi:SDR family mycofactocin-dependent oxidoreductase
MNDSEQPFQQPSPPDRQEATTTDLSRRRFIHAGGVAGAAVLAGAGATAAAAEQPGHRGRFAGKVALITGGARGQGRAHAEQLAREGADIVICDIDAPVASVDYPLASAADLEETRRLVEQQGRRCLAVQADVRDAAAMNALVERAVKEFGKVDFLLANAGILSFGPVATLSDAAWNDVMQTNVYGVFHSIRAVLPQMIKQNYGRIVVTSSMAGRAGIPQLGHYSASKWAVIGLVKSVALEVARQGITVNAVCPTSVATDMIINEAAYRRALPGEQNPTREQYIAQMQAKPYSPQGVAWVESADVAHAVLFLLSEEARYISGEAMTVAAGGIAMNSA